MSRHICILAGEPSGDALGARLMMALKEQEPSVHFSGVGGPLMQTEGLSSLFPMTDLSVMGLAEVLPRIPKILGRIRQTAAHIQETKPDTVVTIDSPDFSFRVAKALKNPKPKMIHYVAPTVWAWRPERAKKVAALYSGIICLFPFEPQYFEREGMKAGFTGHSALETFGLIQQRAVNEPKTLGVLFGSRRGELKRMGPVLRDAAAKIIVAHPQMKIISPTLPHLADTVRELLQGLPAQIVTDPAVKLNAFASMDYAIATSGTVGLELAIAGVPHVIGYRLNRLTYEIVSRKVTAKYAHLVNILTDSPVVPEFIQDACTADNIATAVENLIADKGQSQKAVFANARALLAGNGKGPPSRQASSFVLNLKTAD